MPKISELLIAFAVAFTMTSGSNAQDSRNNQGVVGSCPDATAEEAQALGFKFIPLELPKFIKRSEILAVGIEAQINAHQTNTFANIGKAYETFAGVEATIQNRVDTPAIQGEGARLGTLYAFCFSIDEKNWNFMPAVEVSSSDIGAGTPISPLRIPAQTYAVFDFNGKRDDIGNFRYTLANGFWQLSKVGRVTSPNFEMYPSGDDGTSDLVKMQIWVAVDAASIPDGWPVTEY